MTTTLHAFDSYTLLVHNENKKNLKPKQNKKTHIIQNGKSVISTERKSTHKQKLQKISSQPHHAAIQQKINKP